MRKTLTLPVLLAVGAVPALMIAPTATAPKPSPHPVAPHVQTIPLAGVDQAALAALAHDPAGLGGDASPEALTAQLSEKSFQLVGAAWVGAAPTGLKVQVRVHDPAGGWGSWQGLSFSDIGPDPGSPEKRDAARNGTEPLLVGDGDDGVQVRVDTADGTLPHGLVLSLVDGGTSAADAHVADAPPAASASAVATAPKIITRAQWGADESLRNSAPRYSPTVKVGFVHHTATTNSYTEAGAPAQIRSIYAYDTNVLGWSDIAYNFLVDKYGNIYEGRYGGVTKAVIGAHTAGFNDDSFAVSALGCFDSSCGSVAPPAVMRASIGKVLGWKLGLFYRDPRGSSVLVSSGLVATNTQYPKGTKVTVRNISGHRDQNSTACPGSTLYPYVHTEITDVAVAYQGAMLFDPAVTPAAQPWDGGGFTVTASTPASQTWQLTIVNACTGTTVRTLSGTASGPFTVAWDGNDTAGAPVRPGTYRLTLTSGATWSSTVEVTSTATSPPSTCPVRRLAGDNRYETAVAEGQAAFPTSTTVVLVNGSDDHLVDGLVAAPLARALSAPVLLANSDSLPQATTDEITRRKATTAYLVGGSGVLGSGVTSALKGLGVTSITQIDGANRFDTSAKVADRVAAANGGATRAIVASGEDAHLVDALSAGGVAAATKQPILLAGSGDLPTATADAIQRLGITTTTVLGTSEVIPDAVLAELPGPSRAGGSDRYATALAVADAFAAEVDPTQVAIASGADGNRIDSLAGGALGRITLLVRPTSVPSTVASWLSDHQVTGAYVLGGTGAVGSNVVTTVTATVAQ